MEVLSSGTETDSNAASWQYPSIFPVNGRYCTKKPRYVAMSLKADPAGPQLRFSNIGVLHCSALSNVTSVRKLH